MIKTYVIDTNVLMCDPEAFLKFEDNIVILPITVIEELDNHKKDQGEVGRNARQVSRNLKDCRKYGDLSKGIILPSGGTLKVEIALNSALSNLPLDLDFNSADNRILAVTLQCEGILVTNDSNLSIKAEAIGLKSQDYENNKIKLDNLYTGRGILYVDNWAIIYIYENEYISIENLGIKDEDLYPNQCFVIYNNSDFKNSALVRYNRVFKQFDLLKYDPKQVGFLPRNSEQQFAMSLLLDSNLSLVSLIGLAGSGKTLCALAAGLYEVMVAKTYSKIMLLKPVISMDNKHQLGFLPGTMEEKLAPWMASYYDNIEFILGGTHKVEEPIKTKLKNKSEKFSVVSRLDEKEKGKVSIAQELVSLNLLELGSLEHIRGRSLPNQYIIIDECQNMSPSSLKTVITRAGEGTKIVLLGDIEQIDAPYLDASNNGLTYVADKFRNEKISGHITLTKSERSELAELAANIL